MAQSGKWCLFKFDEGAEEDELSAFTTPALVFMSAWLAYILQHPIPATYKVVLGCDSCLRYKCLFVCVSCSFTSAAHAVFLSAWPKYIF